jgi:hypothetical protein
VLRTPIVLFLSLALVFAALPGVVALSFAGSSGEGDASVERAPLIAPAAQDDPPARPQLAYGADESDCPLDGAESALF